MKKYLYLGYFALVILCIVYAISSFYKKSLPGVEALVNSSYNPAGTPTVFYSQDGKKIAEFSYDKGFFVHYKDISPILVKAIIDAEDADFYNHHGFDWKGFGRAIFHYFTISTQKPGGSTITQQVAKNLLLTKERTLSRKFKDILLAVLIERKYPKEKILEIYLNNIYLGNGAYGVEAAAQNYFHKSNKELDLAEAAMIAGLPPAPSIYEPSENFAAAKARQIYVLNQMLNNKDISQQEYDSAIKEELTIFKGDIFQYQYKNAMKENSDYLKNKLLNNKIAPYFVEEIKKEILRRFQIKDFNTAGLTVYTTLNSKIQAAAQNAVQKFAHEHENMRVFKGPISRNGDNYRDALKRMLNEPVQQEENERAFVVNINPKQNFADIVTRRGSGRISADVLWAFSPVENGVAPEANLQNISAILKEGDEIHVKKIRSELGKPPSYTLTDTAGIEAATVVLNSHTGEVLAMVGGHDFTESQFNRATQAERQVGSSVKPLYYSFALDNGFSPLSLIDSPNINISGWAPQNFNEEVSGRVTMQTALSESINIPSVYLYQVLGTTKVTHQLNRFGFKWPQSDLTLALGSGSTTLLKMVQAYSIFPNKGKISQAYYIRRIVDKNKNVIYDSKTDTSHGVTRRNIYADPIDLNPPEDAPYIPGKDNFIKNKVPGQMISPQAAYIMLTMLQHAVNFGTGRAASGIGQYIGGKTGTTSKNTDAWFIGVASNLVAGAWVGYDNNSKSMGEEGTGGTMPIYIWRDIIKEATQIYPQIPWPKPSGLKFVGQEPVIEGTAPDEPYAQNAIQVSNAALPAH